MKPSEAQIEDIYQTTIKPESFADTTKNMLSPVFELIGAQSGAGKTVAVKTIATQYKETLLVINGDTIRNEVPGYTETIKKDSQKAKDLSQEAKDSWVNKLHEDARRQKVSVVAEAVLHNPKFVISQAELYKQEGYTTKLTVIATHPNISAASICLRYEKGITKNGHGRRASIPRHDRYVQQMPESLNTIWASNQFDSIKLITRDNKTVWETGLNESQPGDALRKFFDREMDAEEQKQFNQTIEATKIHMANRNTPEKDLLRVKHIEQRCAIDLDEHLPIDPAKLASQTTKDLTTTLKKQATNTKQISLQTNRTEQ